MINDYQTAQEKIEALILKRKSAASANLAIQKFYYRFGGRTDALFLCCNWYRRLGQYSKAIKLLKIDSQNLKITLSTATREGRKILWFARFANLLGAPNTAKKLIQNISPAGIEDHRILGLIHLTNFSYADAHAHFEKTVNSTKTYLHRLDYINLADSLLGLGRMNEALKINLELQKHSESQYESALIHQAIGEIYVGLKNWIKAGEHLHAAEKFFKSKTLNVDQAFLQKWLSVHYFYQGDSAKAKRYLGKSTSTLTKLMIKEDSLIINLGLYENFGYLSHEQTIKLRLIKSIFYQTELIARENDKIGPDKASIKINWRSGEITKKTKRGFHHSFGLTVEVQLLILLKLFEDWGINCYCVYDKLYPEDPYGIVHAKSRINALVQRLKHIHGIKVLVNGDRLSISKSAAAKIQISNLDPKPRFQFLVQKSFFKTKDVVSFYLISKTQAQRLIQRWQNLELIHKEANSYWRVMKDVD